MMEPSMPAISLKKARAAKQAALDRLRAVDEVVGVGITRVGGEYAVKVNLREPVQGSVEMPDEIDGVQVCVEVTGPILRRRQHGRADGM
jgi:hypothetical protein